MRRTLIRSSIPSQDVCFFCAFRSSFSPRTPVRRPLNRPRSYNSAAPLWRPATAAAQVEEDNNAPSLGREIEGWKCGCGHVNSTSRSQCTICVASRAKSATLVYKQDRGSVPPPRPAPPTSVGSPLPPSPSPPRQQRPIRQERANNPYMSNQPFDKDQFIFRKVHATTNPYKPTSLNGDDGDWPRARYCGGDEHGSQYLGPPLGQQRENQDRIMPDEALYNRSQIRSIPGSSTSWNSAEAIAQLDRGDSHRGRSGNLGSATTRVSQRNDTSAGQSWGSFTPFVSPLSKPAQRETDTSDTNRFGGNAVRERTSGPRYLGPQSPRIQDSSSDRDRYRERYRERNGFRDRYGGQSQTSSQDRFGRQQRDPQGRNDYQHSPGLFERSGDRRTSFQRQGPEASARQAENVEEQDVDDDGVPANSEDGYTLLGHHRRKKSNERVSNRRSRMYEIEEGEEEDAFGYSSRKTKRSHRNAYGDEDEPMYTPATAGIPMRQAKRTFDPYERERETYRYDRDDERELKAERQRRDQYEVKKQEETRPVIHLPEFITVQKLAQMLGVRLNTFLAQLEEEGFEDARHDHILDEGTSAMFADFYGFEPAVAEVSSVKDLVARPAAQDPSILPPRPPIVTIMGHVDHGKTTILDYLRKSSVVASEHGGITQHIGAFSVTMPGSERNITFLDTPGHAAFLDMRRRGANVTDIVVLVVAADDSVKPQTIEAIKHAKDANVQLIVAINKVDKEDANIERVKQDLSRHEVVVEDYGGDYQAIPVSGKTGQGMSDLEDAIILLADVNDYRAETDGPAEGWVIESKVTSGGRVATILVRRGTLRPGDFIVAGTTWARVRTLRNDAGQYLEEAPPGTPVQVDGWRGDDPDAGLEVLQAENEQQAKDVIELRREKAETIRTTAEVASLNASRTEEAEARAQVVEWEREQGYHEMGRHRRPKDNEGWVEKASSGPKRVHFVVKADVAGSTEALVAAISGIGNNEVVANIIHSGTGAVRESDIKMLAATGEVGYAISFNQSVDSSIRRMAEAANLRILDHNIIYKVTDDVKDKLSDELAPLITQKVLGEAEVGQIFEITVKRKLQKIAGCKITNGTVSRSEKIRVSRNGEVVFTGMLDSLKNVKKDVTEMRKGTECGMAFENWEDFQVGDQIQSYAEIKEKRSLY